MANTKQRAGRKAPAIDTRAAAIGAALFAGWRRAAAQREPLVESGTDADYQATENVDAAEVFDEVDVSVAAPVSRRGRPRKAPAETVAIPGDERAPDEFRPDRDAPVDADKREAFAPATLPAPGRVEAMGDGSD